LTAIGWYFATCIIVGVLVGRWADSATGLEPLFTLLGMFIGLALALAGGIRMLVPFIQRMGSSPSEKDQE
jgi:hypothetical protein